MNTPCLKAKISPAMRATLSLFVPFKISPLSHASFPSDLAVSISNEEVRRQLITRGLVTPDPRYGRDACVVTDEGERCVLKAFPRREIEKESSRTR